MFKNYFRLEPKRILIVRSSSKLFASVCESLRDTFVAAEVDVLTSCAALPETALREEIASVYHTATVGQFCFRDVATFKKEAALKDYSLAVVLYNNRKGLSYLNIDSFAFASGAPKIIAVNIDGAISEITRPVYLYKWIYRLVSCLWVGINCVLSFFVLSVIFCVLCVSAPFILIARLMQKKDPARG
jgi:hypothetical protein